MEKTILDRRVKVTAQWIPGLLFGFGVNNSSSSRGFGIAFGIFAVDIAVYAKRTTNDIHDL
jgi:hypothetical protein